MKIFRIISLISLFIISFLSIYAQKTYIWCGKLIDGHNLVVQPTMTIIIEGNKIVSVEKGYINGKGDDKNIDLKNKTVLPGFIDCHVHLETQFNKNSLLEQFTLSEADLAFNAVVNAKTTLLAGFTTVRDCGGTGVNTSLRNAIAKGKIIGPTLLSSGKAISASGGHMDPSDGFREDAFRDLPSAKDGVADGKDECMKAVRLQFKQGADFIKIASTGGVLDLSKDGSGAQFTIEEIKTIVETAKDYGMKVACHAHGAEGIRRAILGGVASIEHGTLMNEEDMELAKKYNTYYVPTLTAQHSCMDSARIPGYFS
jgi:imidazolonepropionase-like amidohydrolase